MEQSIIIFAEMANSEKPGYIKTPTWRREKLTDRLTCRIGGCCQGCLRHSNGDGDNNRGENNDGRVMGGSSWDSVGVKDTPAVSTCLRMEAQLRIQVGWVGGMQRNRGWWNEKKLKNQQRQTSDRPWLLVHHQQRRLMVTNRQSRGGGGGRPS